MFSQVVRIMMMPTKFFNVDRKEIEEDGYFRLAEDKEKKMTWICLLKKAEA